MRTYQRAESPSHTTPSRCCRRDSRSSRGTDIEKPGRCRRSREVACHGAGTRCRTPSRHRAHYPPSRAQRSRTGGQCRRRHGRPRSESPPTDTPTAKLFSRASRPPDRGSPAMCTRPCRHRGYRATTGDVQATEGERVANRRGAVLPRSPSHCGRTLRTQPCLSSLGNEPLRMLTKCSDEGWSRAPVARSASRSRSSW